MFSTAALLAITIWLVASLISLAVSRTELTLARIVISGVLLLPNFSIDLPFQSFDKPFLIVVVASLGTVALVLAGQKSWSFGLTDLPVLLFALSGGASSLSNGLGVYDAVVTSKDLCVQWVLPYYIGKCVYCDAISLRRLLQATVEGALLYVPLVVFEMRFAPILHSLLFGFSPRGGNDFVHAVRFGFWRPTVFLQMGLQLSLFMGVSAVICAELSRRSDSGRILGLKTKYVTWILGVCTFFCFSSGAIVLTVAGMIMVFSGSRSIRRIGVISFCCVLVFYPFLRIYAPDALTLESGGFSIFQDRVGSLRTRLDSERLFIAWFWERPLFGLSRTHFRVSNEAIADAMWIINTAAYGLAGLITWILLFLIPIMAWVKQQKSSSQGWIETSFVAVLVVVLFWMDCVFNSFLMIIYPVLLGATTRYRYEESKESKPQPLSKAGGRRSYSPLSRKLWPAQ